MNGVLRRHLCRQARLSDLYSTRSWQHSSLLNALPCRYASATAVKTKQSTRPPAAPKAAKPSSSSLSSPSPRPTSQVTTPANKPTVVLSEEAISKGLQEMSALEGMQRNLIIKFQTIAAQKARSDPTFRDLSEKEKFEDLMQEVNMELISRQQQGVLTTFPILDYISIPYSVDIREWKRYKTWSDIWDQFLTNIVNNLYNAQSLYLLSIDDAIPGVDTRAGWFTTNIRRLPTYFSTRSTKPKSWLTPLRATLLNTYKALNTAISENDRRTCDILAGGDHYATVDRILTRNAQAGTHTVWNFLGEAAPTRVLSIRVMQGHFGSEPPKIDGGSRHVIQALVKLDTWQSVEVYDRSGRPLHKKGEEEKKRVVEYLLFEKRMYTTLPWHVKAQFYPIEGRKVIH